VILALPRVVNAGLAAGCRTEEHLEVAEAAVRDHGAELVVLPELSECGYPEMRDVEQDVALLDEVSVPLTASPALRQWRAFCRRTGTSAVIGLSERDGAVRRNSAVLVGPTGAYSAYRKIHLTPQERAYWAPGRRVGLVDSVLGPTALSICYDRMFVAQSATELAARPAALITISAWSSADVDGVDLLLEHALVLDRARAISAAAPVIATNYEGPKHPGSDTSFSGGRWVIDALGAPVAESIRTPDIAVWDVDLVALRQRSIAFNGGDFVERDGRPIELGSERIETRP
jgi:(R)-amidase